MSKSFMLGCDFNLTYGFFLVKMIQSIVDFLRTPNSEHYD